MKLSEFCAQKGLELISTDLDQIKGNEKTTVEFRIISCGHTKKLKLGTFRYNPVKCGDCKQMDYVEKYKDQQDLLINREQCSLTCLLCDRIYYRESHMLTRWLDKYNCFCKLKCSVNERELYDLLLPVFGDKLIRSYGKFNTTKKNYSSDFYIRVDGIDFIINLDDISHRTLALNKSRDITKLNILLDREDTYSIYLQEEIVFENIESIIFVIQDYINNALDNDSDYHHNNRFLFITKRNDDFYDYLTDELEENDFYDYSIVEY